MTLDSSYYLKWIKPDQFNNGNFSFKLVDKCLLLSKDEKSMVTGFTVCEPRDLSEKFFARVKSRMEESGASLKYELYAPTFLKARIEGLQSGVDVSKLKFNYTSFLNIECVASRIKLSSRLRIVNIDDSPVLLKLLKHTFDEAGYFDVVGQCSDPLKAVEVIEQLKPDVITMDIQMPRKTGVEVIRDLMAKSYWPVIVVSSLSLEEGSLVFDALNLGAFDYVQKPNLENRKEFNEELIEKILLAVSKKSDAGIPRAAVKSSVSSARAQTAITFPSNLIWCIGASTGGTQALTQVFTSLPTQIPPTFVVQHIPPVFSKSFADSLNNLCPFDVSEAVHGEKVVPNHVYIAPGGMHLSVIGTPLNWQIAIKDDEPVNRFKPSVDFMFHEIAKLKNVQIVACVLTGMGKDGAKGLLSLKKLGARTFAQDENTSAVYGMPRAAFEIGATEKVVALDQVAHTLLEFSNQPKKNVA